MSKVIVPKNYVYSHTETVSGITTSTVLGSTYTTNFQLTPEIDTGSILGFNITVDYGMSNFSVSANWPNSTYRNITIKNSLTFGCNFIILTVKNLPRITNTGTASGGVRLRLALSDNTFISLFADTVAVAASITIPNQTYYVDLVNNTASTNASSLTYNPNKAVTYNSSYWRAPKEIYTSSSSSTSYSITPNSPHPYIFNNIEFKGPKYSTGGASAISVSTTTNIVISIGTSNNPSYVFLNVTGLPPFQNTNTSSILINLYVSISGSNILISSNTLKPGFAVAPGTTGIAYIDVINKKLIGIGSVESLNKTITHL